MTILIFEILVNFAAEVAVSCSVLSTQQNLNVDERASFVADLSHLENRLEFAWGDRSWSCRRRPEVSLVGGSNPFASPPRFREPKKYEIFCFYNPQLRRNYNF